MSEREENINLDVDPSERTGGSLDAAPQDEVELNVDPSESPSESA